jgi:hypothetical protein
LNDAQTRRQMGTAARRFVQAQQGATDITLALLDKLLAQPAVRSRAA